MSTALGYPDECIHGVHKESQSPCGLCALEESYEKCEHGVPKRYNTCGICAPINHWPFAKQTRIRGWLDWVIIVIGGLWLAYELCTHWPKT